MKRSHRKIIYLLLIIAVFGAYYFIKDIAGAPGQAEYRVIDVIDGDTVVIDDARNSRVRYLGIDSPEIAHQDSPGEPMAEEAKDFNSDLVDGEKVVLEFDKEKYDVYGRILAYVYVDNHLINEKLLREGMATVLIIPPNNMHSERIYAATSEAKKKKKGIWGDLSVLDPPDGNDKFIVDLDKIPRYEGKRVLVRGKIINTRKTEKVLVLNMEDSVDVVVFPSDWGNFDHFDIDPVEFYHGKDVEVVGRVRMRNGRPGIIVNHPMLLRSRN